jgi:hypothetical protein
MIFLRLVRELFGSSNRLTFVSLAVLMLIGLVGAQLPIEEHAALMKLYDTIGALFVRGLFRDEIEIICVGCDTLKCPRFAANENCTEGLGVLLSCYNGHVTNMQVFALVLS